MKHSHALFTLAASLLFTVSGAYADDPVEKALAEVREVKAERLEK